MMAITKIVNDLERIGDEAKKIAAQGSADARRDQLTAQCRYFDVGARGRAARSEMLQGARRLRAPRRRRARPRCSSRDDEIDAAFDGMHAPADQLHDGGPAHDHAGARPRVRRQVDRARRRPCQEHRRGGRSTWSRAPTCATTPADRPRSAGASGRTHEPASWSSRTSRRSSSCSTVNLRDAGYEVTRGGRRRDRAGAARRRRCPTWCCSTGCCPASPGSRSRRSCAPTRARASCRSSC